MKKMSQSFFFVVASKIGDFANRFLNTVLQCCPTIFGRFAHPEAHFLCHFLEFGRGVGNFFEKKQNKSCCFQNVFNFPVAIPEPGSFDRRAISDLMSRMTLEEKILQTDQYYSGDFTTQDENGKVTAVDMQRFDALMQHNSVGSVQLRGMTAAQANVVQR